MKELTFTQMEETQGGIKDSTACSILFGVVFGLAALGGPVGIGLLALGLTTGGAIVCDAVYED